MLCCSVCGGHMRIAQQSRGGVPRVACAAAHQHGTCTHGRSYDLGVLEKTVLAGVAEHLTDPAKLIRFTKGYHDQWAETQRTATFDKENVQRRLNRVTVQIDRYVTAIGESDEPVKALVDKIKPLEMERATLTEQLRLIEAEGNVVSLHPMALTRFCADIEAMHKALSADMSPEEAAPFRAVFRNVFERISVYPTRKRMPYEVKPFVRLAAIMGFEMFPKMRSAREMLAEQGIAYHRLGGPGKSVSS
jgi:site-specific DNA recombinase